MYYTGIINLYLVYILIIYYTVYNLRNIQHTTNIVLIFLGQFTCEIGVRIYLIQKNKI